MDVDAAGVFATIKYAEHWTSVHPEPSGEDQLLYSSLCKLIPSHCFLMPCMIDSSPETLQCIPSTIISLTHPPSSSPMLLPSSISISSHSFLYSTKKGLTLLPLLDQPTNPSDHSATIRFGWLTSLTILPLLGWLANLSDHSATISPAGWPIWTFSHYYIGWPTSPTNYSATISLVCWPVLPLPDLTCIYKISIIKSSLEPIELPVHQLLVHQENPHHPPMPLLLLL